MKGECIRNNCNMLSLGILSYFESLTHAVYCVKTPATSPICERTQARRNVMIDIEQMRLHFHVSVSEEHKIWMLHSTIDRVNRYRTRSEHAPMIVSIFHAKQIHIPCVNVCEVFLLSFR